MTDIIASKVQTHTRKSNVQDHHLHQIFLSHMYAILSKVCINLMNTSLGHSMSSEPMKKPDHLWFYSYLVDLKYHGRYEKPQIFLILYVVVFHL